LPTEFGPTPTSFLDILASAVPTSLYGNPSAQSVVKSEIAAGNPPSWFAALPTEVQSYLIAAAPSVQAEISSEQAAVSSTAAVTSADSPSSTSQSSSASSSAHHNAAARHTAVPMIGAAGAAGLLGLVALL
jgi:hypothetical protein